MATDSVSCDNCAVHPATFQAVFQNEHLLAVWCGQCAAELGPTFLPSEVRLEPLRGERRV